MTIDLIKKVVCKYYHISVENMQSKTRRREIVQARQVSMYFSKSLTKASLSSIGSHIGGKDHATVLHACKTVNNLIDTDKYFRNQIDEIERLLKDADKKFNCAVYPKMNCQENMSRNLWIRRRNMQ